LAKAKEKAESQSEAEPKRFETLRAILWAGVVALAIRSFVVEPFKIPSGSMIPTLLVGDYVLVNKFAYGLRLPITGTLLVPLGRPARGDVMVFRYPDDPSQDFIKRLVGMPGDRIEVIAGKLFINGQPVEDTAAGEFTIPYPDLNDAATKPRFTEKNPEGVEYTVIHRPGALGPADKAGPWVVPDNQYFMMGDNRDNSRDSRLWDHPFVTADAIKGRAFMIHWSWVVAPHDRVQRSFIGDLFFTLWRVVTFQVEEIRWHRIGHRVAGLAAD
jgi:signal peptidase I